MCDPAVVEMGLFKECAVNPSVKLSTGMTNYFVSLRVRLFSKKNPDQFDQGFNERRIVFKFNL